VNLIQLKDASLYPEYAGHYSVGNRHYAYMVAGRVGSQVLVIEGTGPELPQAVEHLVRQSKLVRDWLDVAFHGGFWQVMEDEAEKRQANVRQLLGMPAISSKKDDGGLS
jgi:hypothetical protein